MARSWRSSHLRWFKNFPDLVDNAASFRSRDSLALSFLSLGRGSGILSGLSEKANKLPQSLDSENGKYILSSFSPGGESPIDTWKY